jgi:two-component system NarL family sensor kinase
MQVVHRHGPDPGHTSRVARVASAARAVAVGVCGAALLAIWVFDAVRHAVAQNAADRSVAAAMVPCLLVSCLLVARLPGTAVTRLVTTLTLCQLLLLAVDAAGRWRAEHANPHAGPLQTGLTGLLWLGTVPLLSLLLVVFPDGVPARGVWRRVWMAQLVALTVLGAVAALQAAGVDEPWLWVVAASAGVILTVGGVLRGGCLVWMWCRARGDRRRQIFPFVAVSAVLVAFYAQGGVRLVFTGHSGSTEGVVGGLAIAGVLAGLPIALGWAVLRHRLFGIQVPVNRVFLAVTVGALLFGVYTVTIALIAAITRTSRGAGAQWDWSAVLAAGVTVAALSPLYRLARAGVDRVMFGDRDRPDRALRHLAERLGATVEPLDVPQVVVDAVADALRLPFVALDRDTGEARVRAASRGAVPVETHVTEFSVTYAGQCLAVLLVAPRHGESRLSRADWAVLGDLVAQAGAALHAGRLTNELLDSRERLRQGRLDERARLRRALHDGLSPSLSGMAIAAAAARGRAPNDPVVDTLLGRIEEEASGATATLRALLSGLRPPGLRELGLAVAIEVRAEELGAVTPVRFTVDCDTTLPALAAETEQTAYLVTVEAMVNVIRHAAASRCVVTLTNDRDTLGVRVADDGRGITVERRGDGLRSAEERVTACGGTLVLSNAPAGGTCLEARLPAWGGAR